MKKSAAIAIFFAMMFCAYAEIKIYGSNDVKIAVTTGIDAGEDFIAGVVAYRGSLSVAFEAYKKGVYKFRLTVCNGSYTEKYFYKNFPTYADYCNRMADKGFPYGIMLEFAQCYDEIKSEMEKQVAIE